MKRVLLLIAAAVVSASTLVLADTGTASKRGTMIERLKAADTDGNGMLSRQEAAALPRIAERFDDIDTNKDNQVSFDELRAYHQAHRGGKSADANGDGKISREEFLARAAARFDRLDANKDGVLTAEEMKAGHHRHDRGAKQ